MDNNNINYNKITNDFVISIEEQIKQKRSLQMNLENEIIDLSIRLNAIKSLSFNSVTGNTFMEQLSNTVSTAVELKNSSKPIKQVKATVFNVIDKEITKFEKASIVLDLVVAHFPDKKGSENFKTQVSSLLSLLKKNNKINSYQFSDSKKDTVWGKKTWFNEDGTPKEEYFNKNDYYVE
jgi:hypothetical protein